MRLDRVKNTKRGIVYGLISKVVTLVLPFFAQTIMIRTLGAEYIGIKGLFTSILTALNLTELGVGAAIVYNMYKPIAEDDVETIGALLKLYRSLYRVIGLVVLCIGVLITPFLEYLINGDYPDEINLKIVFILYLANTVLSYWMYAYKMSLLSAYQRMDIISIISTIVQVLLYVSQIAVLILTKNFYVYLTVAIFFTVFSNLVTSACADRMFPEIKCRGNIDNELKKKIRIDAEGIIIGKICGTSRNAFDSVFVSMFLGLVQTAMYANYCYVLTSLNMITGIVLSSLAAGVGNSIAIDSKEENYNRMIVLNTLYLFMSGWMAVCMLCLYQPFMKVWVGEEYLLPVNTMILFPTYFMILKLGDIRYVYSDAAGLFRQNRIRHILEAISNIILNYLFVRYFGIFGILLATIITVFIFGFLASTFIIFRHYFEKGIWNYLNNCMFFLGSTVFVALAAYMLCSKIGEFTSDSVVELFLNGVVCVTLVPILFVLLGCWRQDFKESYRAIKRYL